MRTQLCQIIDQQLNTLKTPFQSLSEKDREQVVKRVLARARFSDFQGETANQPVSIPSRNAALPIDKQGKTWNAKQIEQKFEQPQKKKNYECCDDCIYQHNLGVLNSQQQQLKQMLRKKNQYKLRQHISKKQFSNSLKTGKIIKNHHHIQHMNYKVYPSWWPSGFYCSSDLKGLTPKVTEVKPSITHFRTQDDFYFQPKKNQLFVSDPPQIADIKYRCLQRDPKQSQKMRPAGVSSSRPLINRKRMKSCSPKRNFRASVMPVENQDRHCQRNHPAQHHPTQPNIKAPSSNQVRRQKPAKQLYEHQPTSENFYKNYPSNQQQQVLPAQRDYQENQGSIAKAAMAAAKRKKCKQLELQVQRKKREIDRLREQVARRQQQRQAKRKAFERQQQQQQLMRRSQARQEYLRRKKGELHDRMAKQYQSSIRRRDGGQQYQRGEMQRSQGSQLEQRRQRMTMQRSMNESLGGSIRRQMFSRLVNRIEENNSSDSQFSDYQD